VSATTTTSTNNNNGNTITRYSPPTCDCVVELENETGKETVFLMMNRVCQKHRSLVSTQHAPDHGLKSSHVLSLIEEAKTRNLKQVDDLIAKETSNFVLKDLMLCRQQVLRINARLDDEWGELVQPAHAFDAHIHAQVKNEVDEFARTLMTKQFEGI
jgi:hypothetical protein